MYFEIQSAFKKINVIKICFQIWAVANLAVLAVFSLALVPGAGLTALVFSLLFSLPALFILYGLLYFLRRLKSHHLFSWLVLLAGTGVSCLAASYLFFLSFSAWVQEFRFVLPLSLLCGFSSVLLYSPKLHYLFIKFQYEREDQTN